jgi:hypothetical protein
LSYLPLQRPFVVVEAVVAAGHFDRFVRKNNFELCRRHPTPLKHFDDEAIVKNERVANSPSYPGAPRWVKVFVMIAFMAIALFAILHLASGGIGHLIDHHMSGHESPTGAPTQGAHSRR